MRSLLLAGLIFLCPRVLRAQAGLSSTFFGAFGGISASSGTASLTASGMQVGGFVTSAPGLNVIESGFLQVLAVLTSGVPVNPSYSVTYNLASSQVTLSLPANACPFNPAVTLQAPSAVPPDGANVLVVPGTAVQVSACSDATVPVTLSYANMNAAGYDAALLKVAVYNDVSGTWIPLDSHLDAAGQVLSASVNHLTIFAVVQSNPGSSVGSVFVYPNPFRAARGDLGVTFINLPAGAGLRIYTLRGEEVKDLTANDSGEAFWDVTNRSGSAVATGVYFVLLRGAGKNETIKVGVQR